MKYSSASVQSPLPESRAPSTARSTFAIQVDTDTVGEGLYGVNSRSFAFFLCCWRRPERDERRRRCRRPCRRRRPARESSLFELSELLELLPPLSPGTDGCRAGTRVTIAALLATSGATLEAVLADVPVAAVFPFSDEVVPVAVAVVPVAAGAVVPVWVAAVSACAASVATARGAVSAVLAASVAAVGAVAVAPGCPAAVARTSSMSPTRASRRATEAIIRWIALTSVTISALVAAGALLSGMMLAAAVSVKLAAAVCIVVVVAVAVVVAVCAVEVAVCEVLGGVAGGIAAGP